MQKLVGYLCRFLQMNRRTPLEMIWKEKMPWSF